MKRARERGHKAGGTQGETSTLLEVFTLEERENQVEVYEEPIVLLRLRGLLHTDMTIA